MGKTQKPLHILVIDEALHDSKEIQSLEEKGHTITRGMTECDVIIGSKCWRIIPTMGKLSTYLDLMLTGVRNVRYPKKV